MPIPVTCACGRTLRLKDELAGRKVRCPYCNQPIAVPKVEPDPDKEALDIWRSETPGSKESPSPAATEKAAPPETFGMADAPSLPPPAPAPKRRMSPPPDERSDGPGVAFEEGWFGSVNSGVIGGLLMIVIAVVWFFGGLAFGVFFIYPPILFVIGIISILKGLMGGE